ncbi:MULTISPECIES: hypothetical protein [Bradyrhizobium]|uniref:Uncharacterized protein n=1 Tax=Bradyrhizobium ottawaense TaxID=931866 RepID=A0ABV4FK88_9BRAD|nr:MULTISPECIES: hypothetical protein [Bradyrhizobium]WLB44743.1 hypothetical protein QIH93_30090 [Bradyrhizobium ottawaense]WQN82041.1 hypothetical protein U7859_34550 [Bradyrhizobium ottawaense]
MIAVDVAAGAANVHGLIVDAQIERTVQIAVEMPTQSFELSKNA